MIEFVCGFLIEDEAEEIGEVQEVEFDDRAGETFAEWAAPGSVYENLKKEKKREDEEED